MSRESCSFFLFCCAAVSTRDHKKVRSFVRGGDGGVDKSGVAGDMSVVLLLSGRKLVQGDGKTKAGKVVTARGASTAVLGDKVT
jgi:hypothetical protein